MANTYFQFKHFTIHQQRCAMKVTTDGCLFGAYSASWLLGHYVDRLVSVDNAMLRILDIGSGTGLLSLMIAQKNTNMVIDAIDIDAEAAEQSQENFNASPWKNNLQVHQSTIQDFADSDTRKYDLIISNPPFYEQQLKSEHQLRNTAHHSSVLTLNELFFCTDKLIKPDGYFIVLLPFYRTDEAIQLAEKHHLFLQEKILVKQTPKHDYFRSILVFSVIKPKHIVEKQIIIKDEQNEYTKGFNELLKDYYLKL